MSTPLMIDVNKSHIRLAGGLQVGPAVADAENGTIGFTAGLMKVKEAGSWVNMHSYISGTVTGDLAIAAGGGGTGTLTCAAKLTVTAGGAQVVAGGLTVTAGGATITAGGLTVVAGGATVSAGNVGVTLGNLTVAAGNIAATLGSISAGTTVTAGTGITATTGNIKATAGGFHIGAEPAVADNFAAPTGGGLIVNGTQVVSDQVTGYVIMAGGAGSLDGHLMDITTITATDGNIRALASFVNALAGACAAHGLIGA